MSDTTITLDLSKEYAAQSAARIYWRARTDLPGPPTPWDLAKRVNEVAAEPSNVWSYTRGFDSNDDLIRHIANAKHGGDCSQVTLKEFEAYLREYGLRIGAVLIVQLPSEQRAKASRAVETFCSTYLNRRGL